MNATSPVSTALPSSHARPPSGQDASAESPFSQVLSGEIAQQRDMQARPQHVAESPTRQDAHAHDLQDANVVDEVAPAAIRAAAIFATPEAVEEDLSHDLVAAALPETLLALAQHTARDTPASQRAPDVDTARSGRRAPAVTASSSAIQSDAPVNLADLSRGPRAQDTRMTTPSTARSSMAEALVATARPEAGRTPDRMPDFMTAITQAQSAQAASTASADLRTADRLTPNVGTAAWNQAFGERIVWMATASQQRATLTLNPPDLGPLQVVLSVSNEQATAHFFAAHADVRQALEAALPRLREMMQDAGIQLGQANVSADTARQQEAEAGRTPRADPAERSAGESHAEAATVMAPPVRNGRGLVDTFA